MCVWVFACVCVGVCLGFGWVERQGERWGGVEIWVGSRREGLCVSCWGGDGRVGGTHFSNLLVSHLCQSSPSFSFFLLLLFSSSSFFFFFFSLLVSVVEGRGG